MYFEFARDRAAVLTEVSGGHLGALKGQEEKKEASRGQNLWENYNGGLITLTSLKEKQQEARARADQQRAEQRDKSKKDQERKTKASNARKAANALREQAKRQKTAASKACRERDIRTLRAIKTAFPGIMDQMRLQIAEAVSAEAGDHIEEIKKNVDKVKAAHAEVDRLHTEILQMRVTAQAAAQSSSASPATTTRHSNKRKSGSCRQQGRPNISHGRSMTQRVQHQHAAVDSKPLPRKASEKTKADRAARAAKRAKAS